MWLLGPQLWPQLEREVLGEPVRFSVVQILQGNSCPDYRLQSGHRMRPPKLTISCGKGKSKKACLESLFVWPGSLVTLSE